MDELARLARMSPQHGVVGEAEVLRPIVRLEAAYRETAELVARLGEGLDEIERDATRTFAARAAPAPTAAAAVAAPEVERLVAFQRQLAEIPGVQSITVVGSPQGGTRLVVELETVDVEDGPAPSVVCVQCGRTIAVGEAGVSHGLCPDCVEGFLRGAPPVGAV